MSYRTPPRLVIVDLSPLYHRYRAEGKRALPSEPVGPTFYHRSFYELYWETCVICGPPAFVTTSDRYRDLTELYVDLYNELLRKTMGDLKRIECSPVKVIGTSVIMQHISIADRLSSW